MLNNYFEHKQYMNGGNMRRENITTRELELCEVSFIENDNDDNQRFEIWLYPDGGYIIFDNYNCNAGKFESLDDDVIGKLQENCVEYSEAEIYFAI